MLKLNLKEEREGLDGAYFLRASYKASREGEGAELERSDSSLV